MGEKNVQINELKAISAQRRKLSWLKQKPTLELGPRVWRGAAGRAAAHRLAWSTCSAHHVLPRSSNLGGHLRKPAPVPLCPALPISPTYPSKVKFYHHPHFTDSKLRLKNGRQSYHSKASALASLLYMYVSATQNPSLLLALCLPPGKPTVKPIPFQGPLSAQHSQGGDCPMVALGTKLPSLQLAAQHPHYGAHSSGWTADSASPRQQPRSLCSGHQIAS